MAFSDAFARGYAIGDAMKKRSATAKFFEKFKELSAEPDDEEEMVASDGTAIPAAPAPVGGKAEPIAQAAIPMDSMGGAAEDPAEVAGMPSAALTGVGTPPAPTPAPPAQEAAIPVAPSAPEPTTAEPKKGDKPAKKAGRSLAQDDIKELDRLAMEAARAAGDAEVYTALQRTTDSFLQKKVLSNLSLAQQAADNNDLDATEKYLRKAYRFVPDGQDVKFQRKEDGLYIKDPWDDKNQIKLGSEQIGFLATRVLDPQKWSEMVRAERKDRQQAAIEERRTKVAERGADAEDARVKISEGQLEVARGQLGISRDELALKGRETKLKELMAPIERFETFWRATYYSALGEAAKLNASGKGGKDALDVTLDDAREMANEVDGQFQKYTTPPKDEFGRASTDWEQPEDLVGLDSKAIQTANGLAQAIGARNAGRVSPAMAVQAGIALARAGVGKGEVDIDAERGLMMFDYNGVQTPVMLPNVVLEGLVQQEQARRQQSAAGAAQGLPQMSAPVANPVAPPQRPW
jgi:hypothetical protein